MASLTAQDIASKRVEFAKVANSITLKGKITGRKSLDYQVTAKAGQTLTVTLESPTPSQNFNVLSPSGDALHLGSRDGATFTGKLPTDGDYTIRLYLMGNARDTGATVAHTLEISRRPCGQRADWQDPPASIQTEEGRGRLGTQAGLDGRILSNSRIQTFVTEGGYPVH